MVSLRLHTLKFKISECLSITTILNHLCLRSNGNFNLRIMISIYYTNIIFSIIRRRGYSKFWVLSIFIRLPCIRQCSRISCVLVIYCRNGVKGLNGWHIFLSSLTENTKKRLAISFAFGIQSSVFQTTKTHSIESCKCSRRSYWAFDARYWVIDFYLSIVYTLTRTRKRWK